jgi:hypothetical protein
VASDPWVKIAPPAGEFRWIAARRLSRTPPVETAGGAVARVGAPTASPWQSRSGGKVVDPGDAFGHLLSAPANADAPPQDGDRAWGPNSRSGASPDAYPQLESEAVEVVGGSPAAVQLAQYAEPVATAPAGEGAATEPKSDEPASAGQPRIRFHGLRAASDVAAQADELELKLSRIVVAPPATWQLAELREETSALVAAEQSAEVRKQLRDLLERIATFESVQARYRTLPAAGAAPLANVAPGIVPLAGAAAGASAPGAAPTATAAPAPPQGPTSQSAEVLARVRSDLGVDDGITPTPQSATETQQAATEALYDAVGTLKPVVSRRQQAPRFALVDDHGDVVTFVTANADVNLQPYVGKRIGVRGSRGFMPEYRRAHVTATRVTPLEEKLVR